MNNMIHPRHIYAWISNSIYSRVPLDCIYSINSRGFHGISFSVGCTQVTLTHNQQAVYAIQDILGMYIYHKFERIPEQVLYYRIHQSKCIYIMVSFAYSVKFMNWINVYIPGYPQSVYIHFFHKYATYL